MVDRSLSQRFRWGAMCDFEVYRLLGRSHAAVRSPIVTGELTNVQNEPRTIGARALLVLRQPRRPPTKRAQSVNIS